jgi:hypothetical protein
MVNNALVEIFACFKFAFDSAFAKIAKIKLSLKFHGLQYPVSHGVSDFAKFSH